MRPCEDATSVGRLSDQGGGMEGTRGGGGGRLSLNLVSTWSQLYSDVFVWRKSKDMGPILWLQVPQNRNIIWYLIQ